MLLLLLFLDPPNATNFTPAVLLVWQEIKLFADNPDHFTHLPLLQLSVQHAGHAVW